jgi:hypothetical protein
MNENEESKRVTRRRFVLIGAAGGVAVLSGLYLATSRGQRKSASTELDEGTVLFRNPAFRLEKNSKDPVLITKTTKGQRIAFRMDQEAKALWDAIPTAAQYHKGKETTLAQLLTLMVNKFRERDASVVRQEACAFLREALSAGVVLRPGAKVFEAFEPKRSA